MSHDEHRGKERRGKSWREPAEGSKPVPRRGIGLQCALIGLAGTLVGGATAAESDARRPERVALTVRVNGLSNDRGRVAVALFASADAFPDQKRALTGQLAKIEKGRAAVRFEGLRPGTYAVAVLHDENQNSKMDFNFLGMPLEGYGFSNDASAPFGPPSFGAAAFELKPRDSFIPVRMRYFF
jgi:uncharacterized protein (DUF2141 family)